MELIWQPTGARNDARATQKVVHLVEAAAPNVHLEAAPVQRTYGQYIDHLDINQH